MELTCPGCQNTFVTEPGSTLDGICCPSCGAEISGTPNMAGSTMTKVMELSRQRLGHFQLETLVGKGHFGEVWKAYDTQLNRVVAIKVPRSYLPDPENVERFIREAKAAAKLSHPHIIPVHEVNLQDNQVFIVSKFVEGQTLDGFVKHESPPLRAIVELLEKVASALEHAHDSGIIHRDVKPANIIVDRQGQPFITDFGLARNQAENVEATASGVIQGTLAYMSPEQARGANRLVDRRTDVYALGVILYEMSTGKRPFQGSNLIELLDQIQKKEPVAPRQLNRFIPPDLEKICLKAMSKLAEQRYQTCREFQEDLRRFLNDEPVLARPPSLWERARRKVVKRKSAFAIAVTILVSFMTMFSLMYWFRPQVQTVNADSPLRRVTIDTIPSGASIVVYPLDPISGEPLPDKAIRPQETTPVEFETEGGDFLVVAVPVESELAFHEVIRHVPKHDGETPEKRFRHRRWEVRGDTIELPSIQLPSAEVSFGMAQFQRTDAFVVGDISLPESPPFQKNVAGFFLDTREVTLGEWLTVFEQIPAFMNGQPRIPDNFALPWLSWDEAMAYAESIGKRLPTEFEYEVAATMSGRSKYPWGDDAEKIVDWEFGPPCAPAFDQTPMQPPVYGLYSNLGEWTMSWFTLYPKHEEYKLHLPDNQNLRVVRGIPNAVLINQGNETDWGKGPKTRISHDRHSGEATIGFRCARSAKPRLNEEDF